MTDLPTIEPTPSHRPLPVSKGRVVVPLVIAFAMLFFVFKFLQARPQGHVLGNEFIAGVILIFGTLAGTLVATTTLAVAVWLRRQGRRSRPAEIAACGIAWLVLALNIVVPCWYLSAD